MKVTAAGRNYRCKLKWPRFGCGLLLPSEKKGDNLSAKGIPMQQISDTNHKISQVYFSNDHD